MSWTHMVLAGAAGVLLIIVVASYEWRHPHPVSCPDGYVSIYRTSGTAACASYVVEPVK